MSAPTSSQQDVLTAHLAAAPLRELATRPGGGLVLIAGPARSGRSTTLAALIDALSTAAPRRALVLDTSEDLSSETYALTHALLARHHVGADATKLTHALRGAMARDPDVLVIDELHTSEAIDLALAAACGGTLVLAAVPGDDVVDALQRLARATSTPVSARLAACLRIASCQRLLRACDGTRSVVRELLLRGPNAVAALRAFDLEAVNACLAAAGRPQTLDAMLSALLDAGTIEGAEAYAHARDPRPFARFAAAAQPG